MEAMKMDHEWVSAIASLIVAATACLATIKGWRELDRWKREKRETKRAEIAGEVLVSALRFLAGLQMVSDNRAHTTGDGAKELRDDCIDRWKEFPKVAALRGGWFRNAGLPR